MVSTFCFILSTFPNLQEDEDDHDEPNIRTFYSKPIIPGAAPVSGNTSNVTTIDEGSFQVQETPPVGVDSSSLFEAPDIDYDQLRFTLKIIDWITVGYFCMEYIVRFLCSPRKARFFIKPMNLIDFLAVLPYFISACLESLEDLHILSKAGKVRK